MRAVLLFAVLLALVAGPVSAQGERTGCAIYNQETVTQQGATRVVLQLVDWFPMRAMLYQGDNPMALRPDVFTQDIGDTGAVGWSQYPINTRAYPGLTPGLYTAVFAGVSGGFTLDFDVQANTVTTITVECM